MAIHPVPSRTSGLPEGTGHWWHGRGDWSVPFLWSRWSRHKEGTTRVWTTLLSYFSQTHQSNTSLPLQRDGEATVLFCWGVFPLGNMKPGEMKSPAKTHVRIFPGLDRNCLWHCDLVIRLAVGATPPISGPVLRITSKAHPQQKIKAVCIWCVVPQGSSDALCCFGALGTGEQQWWQGERGWCSSGPLTFPPSNQHLLG